MIQIINCEICNKSFNKIFSKQKTCCKKCSILYDKKCKHEYYLKHINKHKLYHKLKLEKYKREHPKVLNELKCKICDRIFYYYKMDGKYCSDKCRLINKKNYMKISGQKFRDRHKYLKLVTKKCSTCNNKFIGYKHVMYCSNNCRHVAHKIKSSFYNRLYETLKFRKSNHTINYVGCTLFELKKHLEKQFKDGMNWNNWTIKGWHIDHIRPVSSFKLINEEEIYKCWNYKNLKPLWYWENAAKSNKILK